MSHPGGDQGKESERVVAVVGRKKQGVKKEDGEGDCRGTSRARRVAVEATVGQATSAGGSAVVGWIGILGMSTACGVCAGVAWV